MHETKFAQDYSYATCLQGSIKNAWTVDDCFAGRDFDFAKPFLPDRIAGVSELGCLSSDEKRLLNQIRGNSYFHLFAFVEEYIIPMVLNQAQADVHGDETRLWALLRFAEEEVKHQQLMRRACAQFDAGFGAPCGLVPGREAVAAAVLATSPTAALLLTNLIEWFTQSHYLEHVRADTELDPLFRDLLRYHWIDESRHAKMDTILLAELAVTLSPAEIDHAVDELLELGMAVDGLMAQQVELDLDALQGAARRVLSEAEKSEIRTAQQRAYRWTFLVSGLQHPKFTQIIDELAPHSLTKIESAAEALAA